MKKWSTGGFAAMVLGCFAGHAGATVLLDQLPTNPGSDLAYLSQFFDASDLAFDSGVIDDFKVTETTTLTSVSAALEGYGGFSSFSAITDYSVEIFSSEAAASASLTGNVDSVTVSPAAATLTTPFGVGDTELVKIPISLSLTSGTYWVAVVSSLSFSGGAEVGVIGEGVGDAAQVNPNGGFGYAGNIGQLGVNAGYEVEGTTVPEPAAWIEMIVGSALIGGMVRRRRMAV